MVINGQIQQSFLILHSFDFVFLLETFSSGQYIFSAFFSNLSNHFFTSWQILLILGQFGEKIWIYNQEVLDTSRPGQKKTDQSSGIVGCSLILGANTTKKVSKHKVLQPDDILKAVFKLPEVIRARMHEFWSHSLDLLPVIVNYGLCDCSRKDKLPQFRLYNMGIIIILSLQNCCEG